MRRIVLALAVVVASGAGAQKKVSARDEIARLEKELADQRALLVRMLELQNACTTQMINAVKGLEVQTPVMAEAPPPAPAPVTASVVPPPERTERTERPLTVAPPPAPRAARSASLTGTVRNPSGGPAWVFVEDVVGPASAGLAEIKQEDKQFVPNRLAIPAGTRVTFPNLDVVFHNVFSLTPGQRFDLGMQRAGDPVKSRVMSKPGVVEIFCNLHSRMSASILVTPGPLMAKVGRDGTFTIDNVPVGTHKVSAWAGGHSLATQSVEVGPNGASAQFQVSTPDEGPHTNKEGQPYGSYAD